ncbi:MAG: LD-carboxypeptidase, partial [Candidatus Obscuribacterales bacterium]|nr:LD-carboxypeptidase [Candidatus Obscuribacterales bacterium]
HTFKRWSDLAGTDRQRAEDFHRMWADPEVKLILPIRGGNGSVRLLPHLDFDLIAANPKLLVGFSDITGFLIPIAQKTGLVTFHGPTAGSFFESEYTYDNFVRALMDSSSLGEVLDPEAKGEWNPDYPPCRLVIAKGKGRGRLTGGCMTLIRQLMGTPFEIETRGKILFLEDVGEEPHSIDRMVTQLKLAGKLDDLAGIVFGECVSCRPGNSRRNTLSLNYSIERMLKERFAQAEYPVVYGMRIGHSADKCTLPINITASLEIDDDLVLFKVEEPATTSN